jgi:hypothetical protein
MVPGYKVRPPDIIDTIPSVVTDTRCRRNSVIFPCCNRHRSGDEASLGEVLVGGGVGKLGFPITIMTSRTEPGIACVNHKELEVRNILFLFDTVAILVGRYLRNHDVLLSSLPGVMVTRSQASGLTDSSTKLICSRRLHSFLKRHMLPTDPYMGQRYDVRKGI